MRKYVYIGCGGFVGAVLRFLSKGVEICNYHENFPLNTLMINVLGAFAMAFLLTLALFWAFDANIRMGLTTGFLGAFTTFSTLCKETVGFLWAGDWVSAIFYLTVSAVLGLGAAYLGGAIARGLFLWMNRNTTDGDESEVM